jgi:hypothetical protein
MLQEPYKQRLAVVQAANGGRALSSALETLVGELGSEPNPPAAEYALALSELPDVDRDMRDFCIDAMLFLEGDYEGEFKNERDVREGYARLKNGRPDLFAN